MATEYTRIAVIDKNKCQPKACNYLCHRVCPPVKMGEDAIEIINRDANIPPIINEELCTGCGICPNKCPFKAITIINTGIKFGNPIHQFGKNTFRVYSLPVSEKGFITGIIGINGSGKTTSINILSGQTIPNLGNYTEKKDIDKVINYYKGKSLQKNFLEIKDKKLSFAYKIQKVEEIPKIFKKTIKELLENITTNKEYYNKIINELEIENLLSKVPTEVSGGELQRIAIAACLLKDAKLYFFDEYTTFLDIKQRFRIAKILRKKVNKDTSIMLIEHDLAIMDYVSDFTQIMFGKKNAYGQSSNKKTTKKGINEFIDGFLKEENIRIRDYKIEFSSAKFDNNNKIIKLINYPNFEKTLGSFKLNVEEGTIYKGEIIGILGQNAIGKTTFIKILAGEIKPDNMDINLKLKIAYKPQYINLPEDSTVNEIFKQKDINQEIFNSELRRQLDIDSIIDQTISSLSGGELQKVAIAQTLSKDVDIYLIDEPSAFLDIEQRLIVSNVIKSVISKTERSALVVDHDLLLIDYISDRILLFEGEASKKGIANKIDKIEVSFNKFLKEQNITFRQDPDTKRPRANKLDSQKDKEQRKDNKYYYSV
jgi:ATP-binding cassette subfamily E protein 1